MGMAYIMVIRDDAIRDANLPEKDRKRYEAEIGAAVLKLCLDFEFEPTADGPVRIRDANVFNGGPAATLVDEVHSSDVKAFAWIGNCLMPIADLDEHYLGIIKRIVAEQEVARGT